jgi:hypothetical protein
MSSVACPPTGTANFQPRTVAQPWFHASRKMQTSVFTLTGSVRSLSVFKDEAFDLLSAFDRATGPRFPDALVRYTLWYLCGIQSHGEHGKRSPLLMIPSARCRRLSVQITASRTPPNAPPRLLARSALPGSQNLPRLYEGKPPPPTLPGGWLFGGMRGGAPYDGM